MTGPFGLAEANLKLSGEGTPFDGFSHYQAVMPVGFKLPGMATDYNIALHAEIIKHLFQPKCWRVSANLSDSPLP
jgi:hypothetical protein